MLAAGTRIGSFEIAGSLGAGGMGAVYKAIDTKLQREVAIKALPPEFAADPDRAARFEREAQTLASLQHPHIGGIHELLEHDGQRYLVLEYVAGETLAARIARGAVPLDEALPIARHIAEALEAAHDLGIVHRDLKPANVMVQPDGTAKVLDFGLAKGLGGGSSAVSMSPTITSPAMTAAGIILGTAAYMSPEQARGKPVDRRTDVWAFGCVLYEMLTGRMAFAGDTVSDIISGILRAEPDWTPLPADTPDSVRRLLALCLTKDAKERLPHIGLARIELASGRTLSTASAASAINSDRTAAGGNRSSRLAWVVAAVAIVSTLAVVSMSMWPRSSAPSLGVVRFELSPPEGTERFGHGAGNRGTNPPAPHYAVSPDGKTLAFVALESSGSSLWLRSLDSGVAQRLPGTEDASFPFWSPDGQSIAFFAQAGLKRIAPGDPSPVVICPAETGEGGAWAADGLIYFAPTANGGLWRVTAQGGTPSQVTAPPSTEFHRWPVLVNNDTRLLYLAVFPNRSVLRLRDLARGSEVDVLETGSRAMVSLGHLLFQRNGQLWAQRFDEATGALSGEATRLVSDIGWSDANSRAGFHVSGAGVLVHREGSFGFPIAGLMWRDRGGRELGTVSEPDRYAAPVLSPQGDRLAVGVLGAGSSGDIWVIDLARGVRTRLTAGDGRSVSPIWSPEGKEIVYRAARGGSNDALMIVGAGGAATPQIATTGVIGSPTTWVPGQRAVVATGTDGAVPFIQQVPLDGGTPTRVLPLAAGSFTFRGAQISADGQLIAYESDETGSYEVYVQPWPITADKWRVSTNGGQQARWRPSGGELYYVSRAGELMAVSVSRSAGGWRFGTPVILFSGVDQNRLAYVPSRDGERFLTLQQTTASTSAQFSPLHVTLNWQQLLPK